VVLLSVDGVKVKEIEQIAASRDTHGYKWHGVLDLYAALNVATGEVAHKCCDIHTAADFLAFTKSHRGGAGVPQSSRGVRDGGERGVARFGAESVEEASNAGERGRAVRAVSAQESAERGGVARGALSEA